MIPTGTEIGTLVVGELLGQDEDGDLYTARQAGLDRGVTLRVLRRDLAAGSQKIETFWREAWLAAKTSHANILQVHDCFELHGDHYLVREFVDGVSLRDALDQAALAERARVPAETAARIVLELSRGVAELHHQGVLHTDLRPEHVLISRWGEVKLKGLGGARELGAEAPDEEPPATPYAAPELIAGETVDASADVYALGAILSELLSGLRPSSDQPPLPRVPGALRRVVRACVSPARERRPQLDQLQQVLVKTVGGPSSTDCRADIAAWLWQARVRGHAEFAFPEAPSSRLSLPSLPDFATRVRPAAVAAGVGVLALAISGWAWTTRDAEEPTVVAATAEPAPIGPASGVPVQNPSVAPEPAGPAPVAADRPEPASLVVSVYPWASVKIDDQEFVTPQARAIVLEPGTHDVVLSHPDFGIEIRRIELGPGDAETLVHAFTPRSKP